jgi:glucose-6-phosphate dehydrogenase assembly protein OpcA
MHEHPARGIVLAVSAEAERDVQARVLAQCWKPFGKAQQICCEQIEITVRPESWPNVGPTLVGLTAADLPVIFWCRHKAVLSNACTSSDKAGLAAIMNLATKVIMDTSGMEASDGINLIAGWQSQGRVIADLQWTRLTPWREPISHLFEDATRENRFANFHSLEIEHTGEKPCLATLYMAGWLSAPFNAAVTFRRTEGYASGIHRVSLRSDREAIEFERTSPDTVTLWSSKGRERKYTFGEASLTALMTEELSVMGQDPAFNAAIAKARELLSSVGSRK